MRLLNLSAKHKGNLIGRAMTEAIPNGATPRATSRTLTWPPAQDGLRTVLNYQTVGTQRYFDSAGFPGRTVGLKVQEATKR